MAAGASLGEAEAGAAGTALAVFGVRIAAAACAFVAQVLMARLMGGDEYGIFATVWVWTALAGHASTWGLSQAACRFLPTYRAQGAAGPARGFLAFGAAFSLAAAAALAGLGAALVWLCPGLVAAPYASPVLVAALVLPFFALQDFCEGVARGRDWTLLAVAPPYLLRQGLVMGLMLAAVGLGAPAEAATAAACTLAATALSLALQAGILLRRLAAERRPDRALYPWRDWLRASLPMALIDLAGSGFNFVDVLVLGFLLPPAEVGAYFAATRLLQFVVFVQYAASAVTAQRFAAAQARGDREGLCALVRRWSRLTLAATLATGLAVVAAGPLLLGLFGPDFQAALPLLAILVAGHGLAAAFGPAEDLLTMLGAERACAAVTLVLLGTAVALALVLVPLLGLAGAALAAGLVTAGRGAALALFAHRRLGLVTPAFAR
ncbi:lipopolysaccharide biosynthesis protein [Methylobacterium platani]|uniref:Polysaccharide biosynthesis protein n=2 Tax=Methylobacterium platani TaxID=427683 RepID=A0A179S726_9HYPH|nr:lipopolysaccharide biosynthesis protein [Methylobacterium platani]KMO22664.1 polysaccharide biosynthesis protein [Methylobacterium platani JCM 14648]OAS23273.1 polysaccharide biosynthesis protein [Methylobacterium platani]